MQLMHFPKLGTCYFQKPSFKNMETLKENPELTQKRENGWSLRKQTILCIRISELKESLIFRT